MFTAADVINAVFLRDQRLGRLGAGPVSRRSAGAFALPVSLMNQFLIGETRVSKKIVVTSLALIAVVLIALGLYVYQQDSKDVTSSPAQASPERLARFHSPTVGKATARVTIVEFFDPACGTCRDFYPLVKDILRSHPDDIRLVMRYAPFHKGSDAVIKLLEAAKIQGKFWPILEAVLQAQSEWTIQHRADPEIALLVARQAGLDLDRARADMNSPGIAQVLAQDVQDLTALKVTQTPTFFVNGRPLPSFGYEQLKNLVKDELDRTKK